MSNIAGILMGLKELSHIQRTSYDVDGEGSPEAHWTWTKGEQTDRQKLEDIFRRSLTNEYKEMTGGLDPTGDAERQIRKEAYDLREKYYSDRRETKSMVELAQRGWEERWRENVRKEQNETRDAVNSVSEAFSKMHGGPGIRVEFDPLLKTLRVVNTGTAEEDDTPMGGSAATYIMSMLAFPIVSINNSTAKVTVGRGWVWGMTSGVEISQVEVSVTTAQFIYASGAVRTLAGTIAASTAALGSLPFGQADLWVCPLYYVTITDGIIALVRVVDCPNIRSHYGP